MKTGSKLIRTMPLRKDMRGGHTDELDGVYPLCGKCGREGAVAKRAYAQIIVDYDEIEFLCTECNSDVKSVFDLVKQAVEGGYALRLDEESITNVLRSLRPVTDQDYDQFFKSLAVWFLSGVKIDPGKYSLELSKIIREAMLTMPKEERDAGYEKMLAAITEIFTLSSSPYAGQWKREDGYAK